MGMMLKVLTLPFVPALGGFDPAPIEALARQAEILEATPAFFERGGTQYWSVIVACRLHAARPGPVAQGASRDGLRGADGAQTTGGATRSGVYAPPEIPDHDRGVFQSLRQWRGGEADRQGVPAYMILTNRQLAAVAAARPSSLASLGAIDGIGPARLRRYGRAILRVLGVPAVEAETEAGEPVATKAPLPPDPAADKGAADTATPDGSVAGT